MAKFVNSSPKSTFERRDSSECSIHQTPSSRGSAALGGKKSVRAEVNPLGDIRLADSPFASSRGTAADLISVIEGKRGAWSASELAELLGCSGKHIYALAKAGRMPHMRIGGMIRFDPRVTADWLRERSVAA